MPRNSRCRGSSLSVVVAGSRGATDASPPQELEHRVRPLRGQPRALLQEECRVGILEAVDRIAEHHVVARVEVRELVVVVARLAAVGQHLVEVGEPHVAEDREARRRVVARGRPPHLGHHRERRPGDPHVVGRLVVAAVRVHELGLLEDVVERAPGLSAHRRGLALDGRVPLDRDQREDGERQLARGVVVVRGLRRIRERLEREHLGRALHEVFGHRILERRVEAGVAVEPVESERAVQVADVAARALPAGRSIGAQLLERLLRERLVSRQEPGEREAGQVGRRPLPRRPARLERRQAGERVALGDEHPRMRDGRGARTLLRRARPRSPRPGRAGRPRTSRPSRRSRRSPPRPRTRAARPRRAPSSPRLRARAGARASGTGGPAAPRRRFASWTVPIGPSMPRSSSGCRISCPG